jgi:hypothetical protein
MYKELESLGFFEWLDKVHNLVDTDMKPEYLDRLPLDDIHRTVCNAMVFRWFREEHNLKSCIMFRHNMEDDKEYYDWLIKGQEVIYRHFTTYEQAENACIDKLIELAKQQDHETK